ncbi:MAG TPA: rhomboid family intramembrane serine protease [Longimicrobium sp.]|nr:rhomboid family intramembrane serine protease [Longimicrobium sp.]
MIPLRDDNPTEMRPVVTVLLIALNLACWLLLQGAGADPDRLQASVYNFGAIPCDLTHRCELSAPGLGWAQLLTSMFMHGGWQHILGNMLFLWVFGNNIEDSMGHVRFILFYLICGIAAGLAHVFLSPGSQVPAVGASGAISGVMGAYVVLYPQARVQTWIPPLFIVHIRAWFFLIYWFFIQVVMGVGSLGGGDSGGVAVWAHVGGFVAGLALIKVFESRALVEARRHRVLLSRQQVARDEWRL